MTSSPEPLDVFQTWHKAFLGEAFIFVQMKTGAHFKWVKISLKNIENKKWCSPESNSQLYQKFQ